MNWVKVNKNKSGVGICNIRQDSIQELCVEGVKHVYHQVLTKDRKIKICCVNRMNIAVLMEDFLIVLTRYFDERGIIFNPDNRGWDLSLV